jgi:serine/threonine protein kinase HipA of HipAB toxin-antitoxin module
VRTTAEIKAELERTVDRRTELWHELAEGHDAVKSADVARLSSRIEELWAEARSAEARARFGSPELIQARARAEERLERDARRKAA